MFKCCGCFWVVGSGCFWVVGSECLEEVKKSRTGEGEGIYVIPRPL